MITYSSLLNRLQLIGATIVKSPPAPEGSVWLFGKKGPFFPFIKGPIYPIKVRPDGDIVPRKVVEKILRRLGLGQDDQVMFWDIQEHNAASAP